MAGHSQEEASGYRPSGSAPRRSTKPKRRTTPETRPSREAGEVPTGILGVGVAVSHPLRVKALEAMTSPERRCSATDIADEIGVDVKRVSYHMRELATLGFIEQVDERPVRGSLEKIFAPVRDMPSWGDREWARMPKAVKAVVSGHTLGRAVRSLGAAIDSGEFLARDDSVLNQGTFWTDDQGALDVLAILSKAAADVAVVEATTKARLSEAGKDGFALSHLIGGYQGGLRAAD